MENYHCINFHLFNYLFKDKISEQLQHICSTKLEDLRAMEEKDIFSELSNNLPENLDYRSLVEDIYDQSNFKCGTSSTTSAAVNLLHAIINENRYSINKLLGINKTPKLLMSRLHNYWNAKIVQQSNIFSDDPVMIESSLIAIKKRKMCPESYWPYMSDKISEQPSLSADYQASLYPKSVSYRKLSNHVNLIKYELHKGHPVLMGIILYSNWNTSADGLINLPTGTSKFIGAHTILLVGYNNNKKYFIFQNSLGKKWGSDGFGFIEYGYIYSNGMCGDIYSIYI